MNSPFIQARAEAMADRLIEETTSLNEGASDSDGLPDGVPGLPTAAEECGPRRTSPAARPSTSSRLKRPGPRSARSCSGTAEFRYLK